MEQQQQPSAESPATNTAHTTTDTAPTMSAAAQAPRSHKTRNTIVALVIAAMLVGAAAYVLEKQGRTNTNFFGGISGAFVERATVAVVNSTKITQSQLNIGISQLNQAAVIQGVDVTNDTLQNEIRTQALDVLVNTELLKQAALERGITVDDETVAARVDSLKEEVGAEVLQQRMAELGLDESKLFDDVASELTIQQLLDELFASDPVEITEEEVTTIYDAAAAVTEGLPPLEEVRSQVEAQIKASKEQEMIDAFIDTQRAVAQIEIVE